MFIIPFRLQTVVTRVPYANAFLVACISLVSIFAWIGFIPRDIVQSLVLRDWDITQLIGNVFLHADPLHLLGNMLFLWVFGNAVCALVGDIAYIFLFVILSIAASSVQLMFNGQPTIGASGAINGIVAMTFLFFPVNRLECAYFFWFIIWAKAGIFRIRVYWMILLWFIFDIYGIINGSQGIAYWDHLGGFIFGFFIAMMLIEFTSFELYDPTFMDVVTGRMAEREEHDLQDLKDLEERRQKNLLREEQHRAAEQVRRQTEAMKQEYVADPVPQFRILNELCKNGVTTLFFINDGDAIENPALRMSDIQDIEIQPIHLGKRASGWIRFPVEHAGLISGKTIRLRYNTLTGYTVERELVYDTSQRKFSIGESLNAF